MGEKLRKRETIEGVRLKEMVACLKRRLEGYYGEDRDGRAKGRGRINMMRGEKRRRR